MKIDCTTFLYVAINLVFVNRAYSQAPSISSFTPTSGPIGTSVSITGSNFSTTPADNIVYFGATKATVSASTPTQLTTIVPAGSTYQPITVTANGLTAYSNAPFVVTFPSNKVIDESSFADKVDFGTGLTPFVVAMGDLDGDGKMDLATSNAFSAAISVLKNASSSGVISPSSFDAKVDFATEYGPYGLAVGDLDGDGKLDMVVIYNGWTISVYKNISSAGTIGSGSFASKVDFTPGSVGTSLTAVAIGDLDADGKPDLAVTDQTGNRISVFKNTSTTGVIDANSFTTKVDFATAALPMGVAIADLDGDGKPELAVANVNGNSVSVFKNTCVAGTIDINSFAAKIDFISGPNGTTGLAIGDLDDDGKPDIAVSNYYSNTVSILKNTITQGTITSASFATKVDFTTATGPQSIAMGDLDGDGKVDLAVANFSANVTDATANKISVFKNTTVSGAITTDSFAPKIDFGTGANPVTVVIGDLDGDGKPDLVVTNRNSNTVSVLRNKDSQTITSFTSVTEKKIGDPSFTLFATSSSGLAVQFTTPSDKVTISGSEVSVVNPGSVTIAAGQPGNAIFSAAPKVLQTFCINPAKPAIAVNATDPAQPLLTSSSDIGNQWYLNENLIDGATGKTYVVKEKGIYKVKVSVDGCSGPFSEGETLIITGDVSNLSPGKAQLYPNPVQDLLTLRLDGFKENDDVNVTLIDRSGKTITRQDGKGGQELIVDVRSHSGGLYFITMIQGSLKQHARFIKK